MTAPGSEPTPEPAAAKARPSHVLCPRCGYDLSAVIDHWTAAGFNAGQCSECGHEVGLAALARQGVRAVRLAESRRRDFIEVGHDRYVRRFFLTSLRAVYATGMFPWITRKQQINSRRLAWFLIAWLLIWITSVFVPAIIGSMVNMNPTEQNWLVAMPLIQSAVFASEWIVSVIGTWVFTRRWFRGYRTAPEPDHFLRVMIYAACGRTAVHTALWLYQSAVIILAHASGASFLSILL